jgi:phage terminase small subunit
MTDYSDNVNPPLNPQQWRFVEEYLIDPSSQTKAAIRAGYSEDSATQTASRLLSLPKVQEAIEHAQKMRAEEIGISKTRILQELALIAFAKINELSLEDLENTPLQMIASQSKNFPTEVVVTSTKGKNAGKTVTVKTVKTADKLAALDKLGKHLGMFKEQVEVGGSLNLTKLIEDSYKSPEPSDAPSDNKTPEC